MRTFVPLLLLPIVLFLAPRSSHADKQNAPCPPHPPYSLIRDTSSPSHKYVLAWGVKGKKVNWFLAENPPEKPDALFYRANAYFDDLITNKENIQNYLVDRRVNRILGVVPLHHRMFHLPWDKAHKYSTFTAGGDYWAGVGGGKNHAEISTYWLRDESIGILLYNNKWWYDAIYIAEKIGGKFRITEVGDLAESYLRRYLDRTKHQAYQAAHTGDDRNPTIEARNFRLTRNSLRMDVYAYIPKHFNQPGYFFYGAAMRLALTHHRKGLGARIISLKSLPRQPYED